VKMLVFEIAVNAFRIRCKYQETNEWYYDNSQYRPNQTSLFCNQNAILLGISADDAGNAPLYQNSFRHPYVSKSLLKWSGNDVILKSGNSLCISPETEK